MGCTPPRASRNPLRCALFTTAHLGIFLLTQSRAQTRRVIIEPAGSPSGVAKPSFELLGSACPRRLACAPDRVVDFPQGVLPLKGLCDLS